MFTQFVGSRACRHWLIALSCLIGFTTKAQLRWDGEAGDGQWLTPANWSSNQVPVVTDSVLLDNSLLTGNYIVSLPGNVSTTVKSITISASSGNSIQLNIPALNTIAPALVATGPGYGITLNAGGIINNSSGATGNAIIVSDSFRINNGGRYTHRSRSAHASLVTILSHAPGTEHGIFEFDVPGGGYTIASTGRNYGTLMLSSMASAGTQVYASNAASPVTINGDLIIQPGVSLNLDVTAAFIINGDLIQNGGILNLASQPNNNILTLRGQFLQFGGLIAATAHAFPSIELAGNATQHIMQAGSIADSITLTINNSQGVGLLTDLVLPYKLKLVKGIITTGPHLVTLQAGCGISADSASATSFINGTMRKEGLTSNDHFLFPIGNSSTQRWLALNNATGSYTASYFSGSAAAGGQRMGTGIDHISSTEYWKLQADALPAPAGQLQLSFDNAISGGITDLASLRVAQLFNGSWLNKGNTGTTGTAGATGSVTSDVITSFDSTSAFFTLAGANPLQNPLPVRLISFTGRRSDNGVVLVWHTSADWEAARFDLQVSADAKQYITINSIAYNPKSLDYGYLETQPGPNERYYRLRITEADGSWFYSNSIIIQAAIAEHQLRVSPSVTRNSTNLFVYSSILQRARALVTDAQGKCFFSQELLLQPGNNKIPLHCDDFPAAIYIVSLVTSNKNLGNARFVKQ